MVSGCPRLRHTASKLRCQFVTVSADQMLTGLYINDIHSVRLASTRLTEKKKRRESSGIARLFPTDSSAESSRKELGFYSFVWMERKQLGLYWSAAHKLVFNSEWVSECVYTHASVCVCIKTSLNRDSPRRTPRWLRGTCLCIACVYVWVWGR